MTNNANNSAMASIHRANTVNFKNFEFNEPTVNKYGGKSCTIKYNGQDFYIQTPRCRLPYGLGKYVPNDSNERTKYTLDDREN